MLRFISMALMSSLVYGVQGDDYAPVYQTGLDPVIQESQDYYQQPAPQSYYNPPRQDNILDDGLGVIGLTGALGIGGLIAGFALIQQASIAREQIRSQLSADSAVAATINTLLPTQSAAITSLTASQTLVNNQVTPLCAAAVAGVASIPADIATASPAPTVADLEPIINALIAALMNNPCP